MLMQIMQRVAMAVHKVQVTVLLCRFTAATWDGSRRRQGAVVRRQRGRGLSPKATPAVLALEALLLLRVKEDVDTAGRGAAAIAGVSLVAIVAPARSPVESVGEWRMEMPSGPHNTVIQLHLHQGIKYQDAM
jgi:hypothetical protein